jgi:hypothetical protein
LHPSSLQRKASICSKSENIIQFIAGSAREQLPQFHLTAGDKFMILNAKCLISVMQKTQPPGVFIYRLILGLVRIAGCSTGNYPPQLLANTVNYGMKSLFILMSIAMGVAFPMMISRNETAKNFFVMKQGRRI